MKTIHDQARELEAKLFAAGQSTTARIAVLEEALRQIPGPAASKVVETSDHAAGSVELPSADMIYDWLSARTVPREDGDELVPVTFALAKQFEGWLRRADRPRSTAEATPRNDSSVAQESKWPCFWCGSMQAHETGYPGGMSTVPACAQHAEEYSLAKALRRDEAVAAIGRNDAALVWRLGQPERGRDQRPDVRPAGPTRCKA